MTLSAVISGNVKVCLSDLGTWKYVSELHRVIRYKCINLACDGPTRRKHIHVQGPRMQLSQHLCSHNPKTFLAIANNRTSEHKRYLLGLHRLLFHLVESQRCFPVRVRHFRIFGPVDHLIWDQRALVLSPYRLTSKDEGIITSLLCPTSRQKHLFCLLILK